MYNSWTCTAKNDARFNYKKHFILSDINKQFLKCHGITGISVEKFKEFVKTQSPEFKTIAGSFRINIKKVKVYNIETIKENLRRLNEYQN